MAIPTSVSTPNVTRSEVAGYRYRATAALLDYLLLYTMIFLVRWSWVEITRPRGAVPNEPLPFSVVVIGLYVLATTALGRTIGMRALGLRIVRGDDRAALGPLRVLVRSFVLLLAAGLLLWVYPALVAFWVRPALLVAYSLWMLFNTKRQMLHDQIAGTVVIRTAPSVVHPKTAGAVLPSLGKLDPPQAKSLLDELEQVRRKARGNLHAASVPVLVLGLLAFGGALASWRDPARFTYFYWTFAGPAGLLVTAWWFRRLQHRHGAGTGAGPLVTIAILVAFSSVVYFGFLFGSVITGLGFIALAITQRNRLLAAAAAIFALVTGAQQPFRFISDSVGNSLWLTSGLRDVFSSHGTAIVFAVLGLLLLGVGVSAFRQERVR